jgi:centromere protein C
LENSLEEVVDHYDDDDNDGGGGGGMQLATQQMDDDEQSYGGGGGNNDYFEDDDDGNNDMVSASQRSRGSSSRDEDSEPPMKKKKSKSKDEKKQKQQRTPVTPTSVLRTSKSKKNKKKQTTNRVNWSTPNGTAKGIPAGPREYEAIPVTDYKSNYPPGEEPQTPGGSALRRSRRARFKPLQFWKNEKLIYEAQNEEGLLGEAMGDMPVVAGVMHALPTPYKEVKRRERETTKPDKKQKKKDKRKRGEDDSGDEDDNDDASSAAVEPFDDKALRKKYRIRNGESGTVWSETLESTTDTKIVSRLDNRTFSKLPLSSARGKRESKVVGFASQSFQQPTDADDLFPGYIAGNVVIPPRGIKDAEGVGLCSQVFTVGECQPNSLELAVADPTGQDGEFDPDTAQRYLLSKGDMFQIPPGNVYRIENHSKKTKAALFWVIIKCMSKAEQDDESEEG